MSLKVKSFPINSFSKETKLKWLVKVKKISAKIIDELKIHDDGEILKLSVYNFQNEIIGLRIRNVGLDEQWRQQSDTPIFPFNHINIDHNLPLIIAEGETSSLTIYQLISKNIIGTPGTMFKSEWARHFINIPKVLVIPDNNSVGMELAMKIQLEFAKLNIPTETLKIPKKYVDISEFYLKTNANTIKNWFNQKIKVDKLLTQNELKMENPIIFGYSDFINYGSVLGDMPFCFLEGLALVGLAGILSNKLVWKGTSVMEGMKTNLAIILASDSTRARKTESLKILIRLITDLDESILLPQYFSPEALINIMSDRNSCNSLLLRDEWGRFQEKLQKADWTKGTKELLIQLIDGYGFKKETVGKGVVLVKNPYLSIAGTATIESLMSSSSEGDLLSGYISRFAFMVPARLRPRKALAELDNTAELYAKLLHKFQKLKKNSEYQIDEKVEKFSLKNKKIILTNLAPPYFVVFKNYETLNRFDKFEAQMEMIDDKNPHLSPTHTRLAWITLKVAILLAAANFFKTKPKTNLIEIDINHLIYSIKLCTKWIRYQRQIVEKIGSTPFENILTQIERFLTSPKSRSQIMRRFSLTSKLANDVRETLLQRGLIEILSEKTKTKRAEIWKLR